MRKQSLRVIVLMLSLFIAGGPADGAEVMVVSGNPNAPPVVWEQHQQLIGLGPDLARDILEDLGIAYTLRRFGDWKNVQINAKNGSIDLLVSAYRNKTRDEYLVFSIPYLSQPAVIVVEKGKEFELRGWDALIGKKGVTNVGESYGQDFDEFLTRNLDIEYHQFERGIELLNLGEVDYLIADLFTALIYSRLLRGEDAVTVLDPPVTVQDFHLAIRRDSPLAARLPEINKKLQEKIDSGEISRSFMSYFDHWKALTDRRDAYFDKDKSTRSAEQQAYIEEQDEMARQRIYRTMTDREGLPGDVDR